MADPYTNNLTTLARRLKPFFLAALRAAPGVAAVMLNRILLIPGGTDDPGVYEKSAAGLAEALAAAVSGDAVWLPPCALSGSQTVPAGVSLVGVSRERCAIAGQVTLGAGAALENLAVSNGSGPAVVCAGSASIYNCTLNGSTYGISAGVDTVYVEGGWLAGGTAPAGGETSSSLVSYSYAKTETQEGLGKLADSSDASEGWELAGFDDSGWNDPYLPYSSWGAPISGTDWICDPDEPTGSAGKEICYRHEFEITGPCSAVLTIRANDMARVFINGVTVLSQHNWYEWFGYGHDPVAIKHDAIEVPIDPSVFVVGTNCIGVIYKDQITIDGIVEDDPGVELTYKLNVTYGGGASILTSGVRMDAPVGEPTQGERSVWDAEQFPSRHANDIDALLGIHHTLGTGSTQAAAGDHLHYLIDISDHDHSGDAGDGGTFDAANLTSASAGDGDVLTADGSGGAAWEAPAGGSALTVKEADGTPSDSAVTEIRVTNGKLTSVSAGVVSLDLSGGSMPASLGNGWDVDANPASAHTADDNFDDSSLDGAWTEYDPGSSVTVAEGADHLKFTEASSGSYSIGGIYKAHTFLTNQMFFAKLAMPWVDAGDSYLGLALFEDATDSSKDIISLGLHGNISQMSWSVDRFPDYNHSSTNLANINATFRGTTGYFRIRKDGGVWRFEYSADGIGYVILYNYNPIPFTPTHIGFMYVNVSTSVTIPGRVQYFRVLDSNDGMLISGNQVSFYA
jgi:hypothetical protein